MAVLAQRGNILNVLIKTFSLSGFTSDTSIASNIGRGAYTRSIIFCIAMMSMYAVVCATVVVPVVAPTTTK